VHADQNLKGNAAELAVAAEAAKLGLTVLMPMTEHERYDLVLGISGRLLRVQCKWGSIRDGTIRVRLDSSYHSPTRGYVVKTYAADEIDLVAVHCGDLRRSYLLPQELFAGRSTVYLRLAPARNNQRASLNLAADYEFPGAVAQLAERSDGIRKVRGSIPLSSTTDDVATKGVGMDRFYAGLAHYVRRAEAGGEVVVTRRGKPVARLVPAALNPAPVDVDE
jgi:prevent-host-death family protein